jgi:prevent-host-death family protein
MLKITDQQFQKRFFYILNKVSNGTPTIITRKHNPSLVLLSLEDCKEMAKMLFTMQDYYELFLDMQEIKNNNKMHE